MKKAFVFDLDGTLFETSAREIEGATGHARYVEFTDSDKLLHESKPLSLASLAVEVQNESHDVYILTARSSNLYPAIKKLLARHGISAKYVFCVGDRGFNIPAYKAEILAQLKEDYHSGSLYFFDDDEANLEMAPANIRKIKA